jgi:hypothetical protein
VPFVFPSSLQTIALTEKTMRINGGVLTLLASMMVTHIACDSFLDVDPPNSKIPSSVVFTDDAMANSALAGIYTQLYLTTSFASGSNQSIVACAGLSADELWNNPQSDPKYLEFQNNNINPSNTILLSLWNSMYNGIYQANATLEGLDRSSKLTVNTKSQLTGEALFVRGFCYFYLVNFFGDVPLTTTTSYEINNRLPRSAAANVYRQIIEDLSKAEDLLDDEYLGTERIRPNKFAASSLLARVYLYQEDWARAEDKATKVIEKTALYQLAAKLPNVFLSASTEAIWQLRPSDKAYYTNEGYYFSVFVAPNYNVLRTDVLNDFENGDLRLTNWTTSLTDGEKTIYLPFKYKKYIAVDLTNEYSIVIRLAELYLIRAEAMLMQGKLAKAIEDVDKIRYRAGLALLSQSNPTPDEGDILDVIQHERRIELMTEWAHRWLDLRRWKLTETILKESKPGLSQTDLLYPIPSTELTKNTNLNPQNPGY